MQYGWRLHCAISNTSLHTYFTSRTLTHTQCFIRMRGPSLPGCTAASFRYKGLVACLCLVCCSRAFAVLVRCALAYAVAAVAVGKRQTDAKNGESRVIEWQKAHKQRYHSACRLANTSADLAYGRRLLPALASTHAITSIVYE